MCKIYTNGKVTGLTGTKKITGLTTMLPVLMEMHKQERNSMGKRYLKGF